MHRTNIAVIGSDGPLPKEAEEAAEYVGEEIAENNCILVCGGRGGVMEAACRGARKAGGLTVGILPSTSKKEANPHVDVALTTGLGYTRNALVVLCADAVIAVHGSVGTLSEIGLALSYGKPVVAVKESGGVAGSLKEKLGGIDRQINEGIHYASKEDAVEKALKLISRMK